MIDFEWDLSKARANLRKHQVTFQEAATVLRDPLAITIFDPDHSEEEDRYITIGTSEGGLALMVAHTDRRTAPASSAREHSPARSVRPMKTKSKDAIADELRPAYDLGQLLKDGVRGNTPTVIGRHEPGSTGTRRGRSLPTGKPSTKPCAWLSS